METLDPTALSLLPALVAIGLAFATRRVLPALFVAIVAGGVAKWFHTGELGDLNFVKTFMLPALGTEKFARILLIYLWCLGGLTGLWEKTGGALHFAEVVGKRLVQGPRSALAFAWVIGCVFHQGGTVSTVLAGTTVKPVADAHRVSHEELSYVVDSTASPVATVLPFNAWPAYVAGLIVGTAPMLATADDASLFFFSSLPFNFYGWFAVLGTLLFSLGVLPAFGAMATARDRARETGALDSPHAEPMLPTTDTSLDPSDDRDRAYDPSLWDFLLPIATLLGLAVVPYVYGYLTAKPYNWIDEAFAASVMMAMTVALVRGMPLGEVVDGFVSGCKSMTIGAIVLGLAVTLGEVSTQLHTSTWLVAQFADSVPQLALPAVLALLCMGIAFSTGTSWGTYAVVFPVAMPFAYALNPDPTFLQICFGAVLGGAVFGDQCSPISDTTILSAMFTGADLMDHVKTQLPLALGAAAMGMLASTAAVLLLV
ncbi:MAG: sodium:proton antiporter [Deltaproteobacteria bacterium]|nr:MAG: sodium:proton antiporter [Deltaproteobacteria bacterium]